MNRLQSRYRVGLGLIVLLAFAAQIASAQSTRPTTAPVTGSKFLRFVPEDNGAGGALETSVVTYRNAAGATVDLIAAIHIADASFFHDLDKSFTQYDSLLYEMVKPKDADMGAFSGPATQPGRGGARDNRPANRPLGWVGMLQHFMKDSLDLTFQLEEIDYSRRNFVHADLDVDTFLKMQEDRGESLLTLMIQQMIRELGRQQAGGAAVPQPGLADILLALQSPDRTRQLKLILAKQFNEIDELAAGLDGPDGTVIVGERNKAAMKVLKQRLAAGDKKLGVFYGAAHLKGMEKILTEEMGFTQVGEPKWRVAWDLKSSTTKPAVKP